MRSENEVEQALHQYGDMIRRLCFVHLQKDADVQDIFQNVFFKYAMSKKDFTSMEHEKAWLLRIAINECHSFKRRFFHQKVDLVEDFNSFGMAEQPQHPEVLYALMKLPKWYRDVIYLHHYEGYSFAEIAILLNKKENTIATWHRRAKQQVKEILGGDDFEEPII